MRSVVATNSDASFCQEQEELDGITKNFKLQQACITALAPGDALNAERMVIHLLSWSSTRFRRVCRSTLMAEAYALSSSVEPCRVAVHGLIDGYNSERRVDEPNASVRKGEEKCGDNCGSSKVQRNMAEMDLPSETAQTYNPTFSFW